MTARIESHGAWVELYFDRDHGTEDAGYCWRNSMGDGDVMPDRCETFADAYAVAYRIASNIGADMRVAASARRECQYDEGYDPTA